MSRLRSMDRVGSDLKEHQIDSKLSQEKPEGQPSTSDKIGKRCEQRWIFF